MNYQSFLSRIHVNEDVKARLMAGHMAYAFLVARQDSNDNESYNLSVERVEGDIGDTLRVSLQECSWSALGGVERETLCSAIFGADGDGHCIFGDLDEIEEALSKVGHVSFTLSE